MIDNEQRAAWLAKWASMGMEASHYLRDRGQVEQGDALEKAVNRILDLAGEEVGEGVLELALTEMCDSWCAGEDLADDFFADDGPPSVSTLIH